MSYAIELDSGGRLEVGLKHDEASYVAKLDAWFQDAKARGEVAEHGTGAETAARILYEILTGARTTAPFDDALDAEETRVFLDSLTNPKPPTPELARLMAEHRRRL